MIRMIRYCAILYLVVKAVPIIMASPLAGMILLGLAVVAIAAS